MRATAQRQYEFHFTEFTSVKLQGCSSRFKLLALTIKYANKYIYDLMRISWHICPVCSTVFVYARKFVLNFYLETEIGRPEVASKRDSER